MAKSKTTSKKKQLLNKAKAQKWRASETDGEIDEEEVSISVRRRRKKAKLSIYTVETEEEDIEEVDNPEIEEVDAVNPPSDNSNEVRSHIYNYWIWLTRRKGDGDGLKSQHRIEVGSLHAVKKESTWNLLTIFSDHVIINIKVGDEKETHRGWWCMPCK